MIAAEVFGVALDPAEPSAVPVPVPAGLYGRAVRLLCGGDAVDHAAVARLVERALAGEVERMEADPRRASGRPA